MQFPISKVASLLIVLFSIGILMNCSSKSEKQTVFVNDEDVVRLEITSTTTKQELKKIYNILKDERNIVIDFSASEFNKVGIIKNLELSVDCQDGFKGGVTASNLMLKSNAYGFYRDYKAEAVSPIKFGTMN